MKNANVARATVLTLHPVPDDPNLVRLRVGRRKIADIPHRQADALGLRSEQAWTASLQASVAALVEQMKCRTQAMKLLAARPRFGGELRDKLVAKGFPPAVAEATVAELVADGWINEEQQAEALASELHRRGLSASMVRRRLADKGLDARKIGRALNSQATTDLTEIARKRLATMKGVRREAAARRLYAYLARRGHDADAIQAALKSLRLPIADE